MVNPTVQDIFHRFYPLYLEQYSPSPQQAKVLIVLSIAKPELMVLTYNSVKTVDIHRFTIIPVVIDAVPCARRSQKEKWMDKRR